MLSVIQPSLFEFIKHFMIDMVCYSLLLNDKAAFWIIAVCGGNIPGNIQDALDYCPMPITADANQNHGIDLKYHSMLIDRQ